MQHAPILGAQIIDLMMLVVDATKGMQTQTAEVSVVPFLHPFTEYQTSLLRWS
jgi:sulfate adenylyltransferase subunit 1 (EFTu-like GTPase family)